MKNSKVLKVILFLSGILLLIIGSAMLFIPVEFSARNGIEVGDNVSLLNDIRAAGAGLLASGLVIFLGVFIQKLAFTSTVVIIMAYGSYGLGRVISMGIDGMPIEGLVKATVVELIIALVGVFALSKYRNKET